MPQVVCHRIFKATFQSWQDMCDEVSAFATRVGRENLISISQSADNSQGVLVVWYWGTPGRTLE